MIVVGWVAWALFFAWSGYVIGVRQMTRRWKREAARVESVNQQRIDAAIAEHVAAVQAEWNRRLEYGPGV